MVHVAIQNQSCIKRLYRRKSLQELAARMCKGEGLRGDVEVSLLFCDDAFIKDLNRDYRNKNIATDVLSFEQESTPQMKGPRLLGDIVISLETIARRNKQQRRAMAEELKLLYCHGLLHLLGYDHATKKEKERMQQLQAQYLGCSPEAAWIGDPA